MPTRGFGNYKNIRRGQLLKYYEENDALERLFEVARPEGCCSQARLRELSELFVNGKRFREY